LGPQVSLPARVGSIGGDLGILNNLSPGRAVGSGNAYSVAFETQLSKPIIPLGTRAAHNQAANRALLDAMEADSAFGAQFRQTVPSVDNLKGPFGGVSYQPPTGWTWNHALNQ